MTDRGISVLRDGQGELTEVKADIVVIGTGPGGAPWARLARLCPDLSIIFIQQGDNLMNVPELYSLARNRSNQTTDFIIKYYEEWISAQQTAANNRTMPGTNTQMGLGGASLLNNCNWLRPSVGVLEAIEQKVAGWSKVDALQALKDMETYVGPTVNPGARGTDGPINVLQVPPDAPYTPIGKDVIDALRVIYPNYPVNVDNNNPETPVGLSPKYQLSAKIVPGSQAGEEGLRVSAATAFFGPEVCVQDGQLMKGLNDSDLLVFLQSRATKVVFKERNAKFIADGVKFFGPEGRAYIARAREAVVVAGGMRSPQILELSGIGQRALLENLGIRCIVDSPQVGENLTCSQRVNFDWSKPPGKYATDMAHIGLTNTIGAFFTGPPDFADPTARRRQFVNTVQDVTQGGLPGNTRMSYGIFNVRPYSVGSVHIIRNDPMKTPKTDWGLLKDPRDLAIMTDFVVDHVPAFIASLKAIDPAYGTLASSSYPNFADRSAVETYLRNSETGIRTTFHATGACRMGNSVADGVVDHKGRVFGVTNLYVSDAMTLPEQPDANSAPAAFMQGWVFSKKFLEDFQARLALMPKSAPSGRAAYGSVDAAGWTRVRVAEFKLK